MKKLVSVTCLLMFTLLAGAQIPLLFQYQAVVRDASGNALVNQPVNFQLSIISGSPGGTVEYVETHNSSTNDYGIATLEIGNGTPVSGIFSTINWGVALHYIKVEADPTGGTNFIDMGTSQLLSVPYSLYSENAANVQVYSAGNGISISGNIITNEAPDQTVTLTQGGATTVTGTYPNFTISSTDLNTGTPGGINKTVQFNNNGILGGDTALVWDNTNKRLGVGLTSPSGRVVIQGSSSALATEPLFEVKNRNGQQVMVVYEDSVHFYIGDGPLFSNKGGFAVSGRNTSKQLTNNFLTVTPDSTRIFTGDSTLGFGVQHIGTGSSTSYLNLTPVNYFIGHESGDNITTGIFNNFLGYQAGKYNSDGSNNTFIGYQTGFSNTSGHDNVSIGIQSMQNNTIGYFNVAIGIESMKTNVDGVCNVGIGNQTLMDNTSGSFNSAIGWSTLQHNTTGVSNSAFGHGALGYNLTGDYNTSAGYFSMLMNDNGSRNTSFGYQTLLNNLSGNDNLACGAYANYNNITGINNTALGGFSLYSSTTGSTNTAVGSGAYNIGNYDFSTALGASTQITASSQVRIGDPAVTSIGGYTGWTNLSDGRFKKDVTETVPGLEFILKLQPVNYYLDMNHLADFLSIPDSMRTKDREKVKEEMLQTGFIAQDVEKVAIALGYEFSGIDKPKNKSDFYGLRYAEFTVPLVKAVQEQQEIITSQKKEIGKLQLRSSELEEKCDFLLKEIEKLKIDLKK